MGKNIPKSVLKVMGDEPYDPNVLWKGFHYKAESHEWCYVITGSCYTSNNDEIRIHGGTREIAIEVAKFMENKHIQELNRTMPFKDWSKAESYIR